jgi:hypothetical protein
MNGTVVSAALLAVGMLGILASVFSVLGHGITSRSPAVEPFVLFAFGAVAIVVGLALLGP